MLKLLRNVRKAYKQWRALPANERERYAGEMKRITDLVRELGGARAVQFVEGSAEALAEDGEPDVTTEARSRSVVIVELRDATAALLAALAAPAAALATNSVPRTVRLGGKLAGRGVRRYTSRNDP